jgi:acetolactate synthase-1/2/3 large subunit
MINYGNNTKPEILTCTHEEIAVAMAHGYAKMEGKPMSMMCHGVVGLQHAAMALYNAWCDRVPVYVMIGNIVEADKRAPGAEWVHAALDPAALVREFLKWDDQPASLQHFAESAVRAYKIATTPPMGPVLLSLDAELQENPGSPRWCRRRPIPAPSRSSRKCWSRPRARSWSATGWRARPPAWRTWSSSPRPCNARWSTTAAA